MNKMIENLKINDGKSIVHLNKAQNKFRIELNHKIKTNEYAFEGVSCAICGENSFNRIASKDRYGFYSPVSICENCGLVQLNPRMNSESYSKFYQYEYYPLYFGKSTFTEETFIWQYFRGKKIFDIISNRLGRSLKSSFVLDVGCGPGGILKYFKEKGNSVLGFELDKKSIEFGNSRGIDITDESFGKFEKTADLIICCHVLEHLLDPVSYLNEIREKLKKDGLFYVEIPLLENINREYFGEIAKCFQNAHVYYFTKVSLENLARKSGFRIVWGENLAYSLWFKCDKDEQYVNDFKNVNFLIDSYSGKARILLSRGKVINSLSLFLRKIGVELFLKRIYFWIKTR
jgi:2-polyprenyl-3-methyl-5-hydroxy-6-metoxy-1,4-benzoquinol methylase